MIYFLIIPLWLVGLAVCAVLAVFKPARVLAIYLSLSGTFAVILSLVLSTLVLVVPGPLGLTPEFFGGGLLFLAAYAVSALGGGVVGAALGAALAWRITRKPPVTIAGTTLAAGGE